MVMRSWLNTSTDNRAFSSTSKQRLTVAHILHTLNTGGTETQLVRQLQYIDRENFNHIVCAARGGPLEAPLQDMNLSPIIFAPSRRGLLSYMVRLWRLMKLLRCYQVDIVHGRVGSGRFLSIVAAALLRIPVRIITEGSTQRVTSIPPFAAWGLSILEKFFERHFLTQVIAVSEAAKQAYQNRMKHRCPEIIVLHNGIALDDLKLPEDFQVASKRQELGISPSAFVLINVGRLVAAKAQADLLSAFQIVLRSYPYAHLMIVGQGELRETLQAQTQRLGLQDKVTFTGLRDDVPELLAASDLFVLSSTREGLPNSLLEAMAMSRPAVCTDAGGTKEALVDGETGILVPPRQPERLAIAICELIDDPLRRKQYGQAARKRIETEFDIQVMADKLGATYRHLYNRSTAKTDKRVQGSPVDLQE